MPHLSSTPLSAPVRVAVVEDDMHFQQAFAEAIEAAPDLHLAGVAGTRNAGLALLDGPAVDVLLVDLGLPDGSGIDVIRAALDRWPACGVMVSTTFGDETHVMQSIEAGAAGYLIKDSTPGRIIEEIRNMASGGSPISPMIARQVLQRFRQHAGGTAAAVPAPPPVREQVTLSAREQEVLNYITKGFTSEEIAGLMQVSRHTVQTFVRRIYAKLKVNSKMEAIYEARHHGLLAR